jgi:tetratricopeptide (TPR) repeat protein
MMASFPPPDSTELRELLSTGQFRRVLTRVSELRGDGRAIAPDVALLGATAATRLGELERADGLAEEALSAFRRRSDMDGEARSVNLLGAIAWERGALSLAETRFGSALSLAERINDMLLTARAANNIASVNHLQGRPEIALGMYQGALLSYQRLGDRRGTAETYHNIGITYRMLGALQQAEDAINQAVRQAELVGEPSLLALVLTGHVELELDRNALDVASRMLVRAGQLSEDAGDEMGIVEVHRLEAVLLLRRGKADDAAAVADAALADAQRLGGALLAAESAAVAALAYRALGDLPTAAARADTARAGYATLGAAAFLTRFEGAWTAI